MLVGGVGACGGSCDFLCDSWTGTSNQPLRYFINSLFLSVSLHCQLRHADTVRTTHSGSQNSYFKFFPLREVLFFANAESGIGGGGGFNVAVFEAPTYGSKHCIMRTIAMVAR